jgi:hypothetical protein
MHLKNGYVGLIRIRDRYPGTETIGTARPDLSWTTVRKRLGLAPERTPGETTGMTGALWNWLAFRIGNRHSAAGQSVGTGDAYSGGASVWKRLRLPLQGSQVEFAGVAGGLQSLRSIRIGHTDTAAGKSVRTGRADWSWILISEGVSLAPQGATSKPAGTTCPFGASRNLGNRDTAAGKAVRTA